MKNFTLSTLFEDSDLEASLLASLAKNPELFWEVTDWLSSDAFSKRREDWERLSQAIVNETPIPEFETEVTSAKDPLAAAQELANKYQLRLLADFGQNLLTQLRNPAAKEPFDANEIVDFAEENLTQVKQSIRELQSGRVLGFRDLLPEVLEEIEERWLAVQQGLETIGIPTGISTFDRFLGGLQSGIHLLAGEPGTGKTTFALQVAGYAARSGWPVLFVSFEEPLKKLTLKSLCQQGKLKMKGYLEGRCLASDIPALHQAAQMYGADLSRIYFVEGNARLTISQLKAKALQIMNKNDTQRCLLVVDYLQRWASARQSFTEFRHVVTSLVSELREVAFRLDSPVIAISSQNRTGQGRALLTSLKESGDLEYSADTALFLVGSDSVVHPPMRGVDLCIEKNRYGDRGKIELMFNPEVGTFQEVSPLGRDGLL